MNTKSLLSYLPESSPNKPQEYNINSITYQKSNVEESVWDLYIDISINFTDLELNPQYIFQFINVSGLTFSDLSGNINLDRKSTRLNSSHNNQSRMPSSA